METELKSEELRAKVCSYAKRYNQDFSNADPAIFRVENLKKMTIMKVLKFKTNINCGNCVRAVTGFLNDVKDIEKWEVDTNDPEKVLTVQGEKVSAEAVIEAVEDAGYEIVEKV